MRISRGTAGLVAGIAVGGLGLTLGGIAIANAQDGTLPTPTETPTVVVTTDAPAPVATPAPAVTPSDVPTAVATPAPAPVVAPAPVPVVTTAPAVPKPLPKAPAPTPASTGIMVSGQTPPADGTFATPLNGYWDVNTQTWVQEP